MPKKQAVKKNSASDMIHFRPGQELGTLIGQLAEQSSISRGEAAKRLTSLAIHGLDLGFYGGVDDLASYLYGVGTSFDEAAHAVYVAICEAVGASGEAVVDLPRERKVEILQELLHRYQVVREFEEETQTKRIQITLHRTPD